jgi:hypothetical protein
MSFLGSRPVLHMIFLALCAVATSAHCAPDLIVTEIGLEYVPGEPQQRRFVATIQNLGDASTPEGIVHGVSFWVNGAAVNWSDTHTEAMAAGETARLTANSGPSGSAFWSPPGSGEYEVMAWANDVSRFPESNSTNNTLTQTLLVTAGPLPDLVITEMRIMRIDEKPHLHRFGAVIENIGDAPTPEGVPHGVSFWVEGQAVSWSDTWTIALEPGESAVVTANHGPMQTAYWNSEGAAEFEVTGWVDDVARVEEADPTNNRFTRSFSYGGIFYLRKIQVNYPPETGDIFGLSAVLGYSHWDFPPEADAIFELNDAVAGSVRFAVSGVVSPLHPARWLEVFLPDAGTAPAGEHRVAMTLDGVHFIERQVHFNPSQGKPDLVINHVSLPFPSVVSEPIAPTVTLTNQGDAPTPEGVVHRVDFYVQGNRRAWSRTWTSSIAPGESVELQPDGGPVGLASFHAPLWASVIEMAVDPQNLIEEAVEDNNQRDAVVYTYGRSGYTFWDKVVDEIHWTPADPRPGEEVTFGATVRFLGPPPSEARDVHLAFFVDGEQVAMAHPAPSTRANESFDMFATQTWTARPGLFEVYAFLDPGNDFAEEDYLNNIHGRELLISGVDSFARWQEEHFGAEELADPEVSGPAATGPDGLSNLLRYALGLGRESPLAERRPELTRVADAWVFRYERPSWRPDLEYLVEASTDLQHWSSVNVHHHMIAEAGGTDSWEAYAEAEATTLFYRLVVTLRDE